MEKEKKKGGVIGWILLFLIFIAAGYLLKTQMMPGIGNETVIETQTLKSELVKISELATYQKEYRETIEKEKDGFFGKTGFAVEDTDNYIITYDPESQIVSVGISKSAVAAEFFINQIYLNSRIPQIPYNLLTEMMFQCLEINGVDLTGPSIIYELLARRVCRKGTESFAKVYGKDPNVNQMSYEKLPFRKAVQRDGALQSVLFESLGEGINVSLANTLNGIEPTPTPLENIIKA